MPKKKTSTTVVKNTICSLCGKSIEYKTKKPLKCKNCVNINPIQKSPRSKWKKETIMVRSMAELLPTYDYIVNGYYSWLLSPKGMPLQLDWYCPDLKIAVEYNGAQHYTYTKYFHKSKKAFVYQQDCDTTKSKICKDKGITLISVPYNVTTTSKIMSELLLKENPELYKLLEIQGVINGK